MTEARMYARFRAGDAACDGRFYAAIRTTGIYCLPSCRARKAHRANVRFFPTAEAARAAGFRACRKCHPDDFARGADPVRETLGQLVAEIRRSPGAVADVRALVRRSGFGPTRLFELFRQYFQATPAQVLLRARLESAARLLREGRAGLAEIAGAVGFGSLSAFYTQFRRAHGLTPAAYRRQHSPTGRRAA